MASGFHLLRTVGACLRWPHERHPPAPSIFQSLALDLLVRPEVGYSAFNVARWAEGVSCGRVRMRQGSSDEPRSAIREVRLSTLMSLNPRHRFRSRVCGPIRPSSRSIQFASSASRSTSVPNSRAIEDLVELPHQALSATCGCPSSRDIVLAADHRRCERVRRRATPEDRRVEPGGLVRGVDDDSVLTVSIRSAELPCLWAKPDR